MKNISFPISWAILAGLGLSLSLPARALDPAPGEKLFVQAGKGVVPITQADKNRQTVSVTEFGAKCNGSSDDSAAFLAAADSLEGGGAVRIPALGRCLIDSKLTVPPNVTFKGPYALAGSPGNNRSAQYANVKGAIVINPGVTITLSGGSGFDGVLVYRKGMSFPAADSSAFAGTAFTAGGDDVFLINAQVMGFNKAYYSNGFQRARIYNLWHDNNNGIEIANSADIAYVHDNHAWPFATIAASGAPATLRRPGIAYFFHDMGDWNKSTNNFSYGYHRGHMLSNVNSMTVMGAAHDNTQNYPGSIGISVTGHSNDTRIILPQAAAHEIGIYINTSPNMHTTIEQANTWVNSGHSVLIDGGDVTLQGSFRNAPYGVTVNNALSKVSVSGSRFNAIGIKPIHNISQSRYVDIGANDYGDLKAGSSVTDSAQAPTIAAAEVLNLPPGGDFFVVSGTRGIRAINGAWPGRRITLKFTERLSMPPTASLKINGQLNAANNTTLTLIGDGLSSWLELGRSVN